MITQAQTLLKNIFGYDTFRPLQAEVITNILAKKDTLVIMPTGGGKSLCYQIPALLFSHLTVVISPLIALMKDQKEQMEQVGVPAVMLNSSLDPDSYRHTVKRIKAGKVRLLYLAPETLLMSKTLAMLGQLKIDCLAIDEAHCISEWGHDFRPEYRQLVQTRTQFPHAVWAAFTATATPRVRRDIQETLGFKHTDTFIGSFDRKNLFLKIVPKRNPQGQIRRLIEKFPDQSGIIYCTTRKQVDALASALKADSINALPYHAGLPDLSRKNHQERFIRDDARIMVATIAFGMGIDKPDIRFVIHFDMPQNIENYYQQIGRAGRDGLPADCLLLFSYADLYKIKHFIKQKADAERRLANIHLNTFLRYIEWRECRRVPLLHYFGETPVSEQCGRCDNCLGEKKEAVDLTIHAQKYLSCAYRTGERFGAAHLINVLRGSRAQRVIQLGHHQLSTYGIGGDLSVKQWQVLSHQFLHQGLLVEDVRHGGFSLSPKAREFLKGKSRVWGWMEEDHTEEVDLMPSARGAKKSVLPCDPELFQSLRTLRKEIADEENVPPYMIFPDRTLQEMAAYFPQTTASLHQIHGVGETKLAAYGPRFTRLIVEYCQKQQIPEKVKLAVKSSPKKVLGLGKRRHQIVGEAYNAGRTVIEVMALLGIKQETVLNHLYRYWCEGNRLTSTNLGIDLNLTKAQRELAFAHFRKLGVRRLKPLFNQLSGQIGYPALAVLRLMFITRYHPKIIDTIVEEP